MPPAYSISAVAKEAGLSAHTIRAWERRYGVLAPTRTGSNRRVYFDGDVVRLRLLRRATEAGHSIGLIAGLPTDELQKLAQTQPQSGVDLAHVDSLRGECRCALQELDAERLNSLLLRLSSYLGIEHFTRLIVLPLIAAIDSGWSEGKLSIAEEHLFSVVLKNHLTRLRIAAQPDRQAPLVVVTTPANQLHELGAMLAAVVAAQAGWNVTYLGPNLPAEEIAQAARRARAQMVALSIVYPTADSLLVSELRTLGMLLQPDIHLVVGGRAAKSCAVPLNESRGRLFEDLDEFSYALLRLRPHDRTR